MEAITIPKGFRVTPEQFDQLAHAEQLARMELTKDGELIIMSPTGGEAGAKNFNLYIDLGIWNRQKKLGKAFDSSTIFVLPNGARRSPDVSWIKNERWNTLSLKEKQGFPPIAPDFVIELVSPSDLKNQRYENLQAKMTSDPAPNLSKSLTSLYLSPQGATVYTQVDKSLILIDFSPLTPTSPTLS